MRRIILCVVMLLAACSNRSLTNPANDPKTVAILSFVGRQMNALENTLPDLDTVNRQIEVLNTQQPVWGDRPGVQAIYANSQMRRWTHDITEWGIDRFVVDEVSALLPPQLKPVPFEYDPGDYDLAGTYSSYPYQDLKKIVDSVRRQPGYVGHKPDLYVLVIPGRWQLGIFERPSEGIGITKDFIAYYPPEYAEQIFYAFHAFYDIVVLDHDLNLVALERPGDEDHYAWRFKGNPGELVDGSLWADRYEAMTPIQKKEVVEKAKKLIEESLPATLRSAGLIH